MQHTLGLTPTSSKWDLRTELTVHVLRHLMSGGSSKTVPTLSSVQKGTLKDPGIKGRTWVAKATIPKPSPEDEEIRAAVFKAVDDMKPGDVFYTRPELQDIDVEWTGFRPDAGKDQPLPDISEEEKYKRLMAEPAKTSDVTFLYFHGGAYYLCDPATHRPICSLLAKEGKGRVCSVRYRLSPQTAFPGQLLDAFMVYLSLLYPPPGSLHEAVPAEKIVIAGDSAGGNLSLALLQFLLQLHRSAAGVPMVKFHGRNVHVPLPAGASASSGWFDISRSLPSIYSFAKYDYLPTPKDDDSMSSIPPDDIWPADPPRGDLFCDLSLFDHPLVSPFLADSWKDSPPIWLCTGQEMLTDEDCLLAARASQQGVRVQFEQYEAMPHCFQLLIPTMRTARRCVKSWGDWARMCTEDSSSLKTNGTFIYSKSGKEEPLEVEKVAAVSHEEAWRLVQATKAEKIEGFRKEQKNLNKSTL